LGDVVRIEETRPISKTKHWRLIEILERRQVAEVRPIELEGDALTEVDVPEEEEAVVEMDEDIDPDLLDLLVTGDGGYEDDEEEDD
jgi:hypothetical protein